MISFNPGFRKIVKGGSFDFGLEIPLVTLVDDSAVMRKTAGSSLVAQWGRIEPVPGHSLIHLIALGDYETTGPNRNGDAFRRAFCKVAHPTFITKGALYEGHRIDGPNVKKGFVVRTGHNDEMGRTELLVAANHEKCAHWLGDLEAGKPQCFSMGFNCHGDNCSICDHFAPTPEHYCLHVSKTAEYPYGMNRVLGDGRRCHVFNDAGFWEDISHVGVGADMIAFDLRKVASDSESAGRVVSGAELAERYYLKRAETCPVKRRIVNRMASIEAMASRAGIKNASLALGDFDVASCAATPGDMFSGLARLGVILPARLFFKAALGESYPDYEEDVSAIETSQDGIFQSVARDPDALERVCKNASYDPEDRFHYPLDHETANSLVLDYGVSPGLSEARAIDVNRKRAEASPSMSTFESLSPGRRALAEEYLAYKVAAYASMSSIVPDHCMMDRMTLLLGL